MKKITALAALTMTGLGLAAAPAQAVAGLPLTGANRTETEAVLQELAGLPVVAPYAHDVRQHMQQTG